MQQCRAVVDSSSTATQQTAEQRTAACSPQPFFSSVWITIALFCLAMSWWGWNWNDDWWRDPGSSSSYASAGFQRWQPEWEASTGDWWRDPGSSSSYDTLDDFNLDKERAQALRQHGPPRFPGAWDGGGSRPSSGVTNYLKRYQ